MRLALHDGDGELGVAPGFVYVQVIAPGHSACSAGREFRRVLVVESPVVAREMIALKRGRDCITFPQPFHNRSTTVPQPFQQPFQQPF